MRLSKLAVFERDLPLKPTAVSYETNLGADSYDGSNDSGIVRRAGLDQNSFVA